MSCRFNVYVAQPEVKPGCVLRQSGVKELEKRKLVTNKEVHKHPLTSVLERRSLNPAHNQRLLQ